MVGGSERLGSRAITPLLAALNDRVGAVRVAAAGAVAQLPLTPAARTDAARVVVEVLRREIEIRPGLLDDAQLTKLAESAVQVGDGNTRRALMRLAGPDDERVRRIVSAALAEIGYVTDPELLEADLASPDASVRTRAARNLYRMPDVGGPGLVATLLRLASDDESENVRLCAALALAARGQSDPARDVFRAVDAGEMREAFVAEMPNLSGPRHRLRVSSGVHDLFREVALEPNWGEWLRETLASVAGFELESRATAPGVVEAAAKLQGMVLSGQFGRVMVGQRVVFDLENAATAAMHVGRVVERLLDVENAGERARAGDAVVEFVNVFPQASQLKVGSLFTTFTKLYASEDAGLRCQLAWTASRTGVGKTVAALVKDLRARNSTKREEAACFLEQVGRAAAIEYVPLFGSRETAEGGAVGAKPDEALSHEAIAAEGAPDAQPEAASLDDQSINVWVEDMAGHRADVLDVGTQYAACFNVGPDAEDNLVPKADRIIALEDIPAGGLATEWIVSSTTVRLSVHPSDREVVVEETPARRDAPAQWTARFNMLIPRDGSAPTRRIGSTPLAPEGALYMVLLTAPVRDPQMRAVPPVEVYREVSVSLPLAGSRAGSGVKTTQVQHVPAGHLGLVAQHEWQTPPEQLTIVFDHPKASVRGSAGGKLIAKSVKWAPQVSDVSPAIASVMDALNTLREKHNAYFDAVDGTDLIQRLAAFSPHYDWSSPHGARNLVHEEGWQTLATSHELRRLAQFGHVLYKKLFPEGTPLRRWIQALPPGARLDLEWTKEGTTQWVPHVPWGLLHPDPAPPAETPVEAYGFLGMRLRLAYVAHSIDGASKALGARQQATLAHLMYWGTGAGDEIAQEATRQRAQLSAFGRNTRFVPDSPADPRKQLLDFLEKPGPSPVALLYLFCQCKVGDGSEPALRFGGTIQASDVVETIDLDQGDLADQPIVFLNACDTAAAGAFNANQLEQTFFDRKCRAFIGTECKVPIQLAGRFATAFFHFLCRDDGGPPMSAGEAFVQARLFLWDHYRNLGGLFYAYVNQYELFLGDDAEVAAMRTHA